MSMVDHLLRKEWNLRFPHVLVLTSCSLSVLTAAFGLRTATSVWSFPLFVLGALFVLYLPGRLVLNAARINIGPLDDLSLSLILGMTISSLLYYLCGLLGVQGIFVLWPVGASAATIYRNWRASRRWWETRYTVRCTHLFLMLVVLLCLAPLVMLPAYYRNLALLPEGGMTFVDKPKVTAFHLSIAHELTHSIPPQAPFLAGRPLGYHCGLDLLAAMLARTAGVSVLDSTVRFIPTFLLVATVLAVFCFARLWLASEGWAALCALLVILGEDFSFVPGLLTGSDEVWSAQFFGMPTIFSLYVMNPMLPAVGVLFGGLLCLAKYWRGSGRNWGILAAFLFAVAMEYKVFVTPHIVGALGVAGLVYLLLFRDRRMLHVWALTLLMATPLVLHSVVGADAGSRVSIRVEPWPYVLEAVEQVGLLQTTLGREVDSLFQGNDFSLLGMGALVLLALPAYLVGSLGVRVLGTPTLFRGLFSPRANAGFRFFLSLFCILGPLATLTLTVTPSGYPSSNEYNNAVWFYVQSKYVLWVLALEWIRETLARRRRQWQLATAVAVILLSLPSSLQFFWKMSSQQATALTSSELELVDSMGGHCTDGQVVQARQRIAEYLVAMTPCRAPVLGMYPGYFISGSELAERRADDRQFWREWNEGTIRTDTLVRYKTDYIVIDAREGDALAAGQAALGQDGPIPPAPVTLVPFYHNADFVVYRVSREDESGP